MFDKPEKFVCPKCRSKDIHVAYTLDGPSGGNVYFVWCRNCHWEGVDSDLVSEYDEEIPE